MDGTHHSGADRALTVSAGRDAYTAGRDLVINHHHGDELRAAGTTSIAAPRPLYQARGRRDVVETLLRELAGSVFVICGAGGLGKSTVAQTVASEAETDGLDVWWTAASDSSRLSACMRALAGRLGASPERLRLAWSGEDGDAPDLTWQLLAGHERQWLLVIDNADDLRLLAARDATVADGTGWVRPVPPQGRLLITSRNANPRAWGGWARTMQISHLSTEAAAEALRDRAGAAAGGSAEAAALGRRLFGVPLMLHQAGLYLANALQTPIWPEASRAPRTYEQYRVALEDRFGDLTAETPLPAAPDERSRITATWELSLGLLADQGMPMARPLLRLLSQFADVAIPYAMLLLPDVLSRSSVFGTVDGHGLQRLLAALADYGLVSTSAPSAPTPDLIAYTVRVHPLIGETMRSAAAKDGQEEELLRLAAAGLAALTSRHDPRSPDHRDAWEVGSSHARRLVAAAARAAATAPATAEDLLSAAAACTDYAISMGLFEEADDLLTSAAALEEPLGADYPAVLRLRYQRARLVDRRGDPSTAAAAYRSVLDDRCRVLGELNPETLRTGHALAWVLGRLNDLEGAESAFRAVLDGRRTVLGALHPHTLWTRHDLAWVRSRRGSLAGAEAREEYRSVLADRTRVLGAGHPHTLWTRHDFALILREDGDLAGARDEFTAVRRQRTELLGEHHPDTLSAWHELIYTMELTGDLVSARSGYSALAEARIDVLGPDHRDTLETIRALRRVELRTPPCAVPDDPVSAQGPPDSRVPRCE